MTSSVIDLDDIDRAILRELVAEGTLSAGELGRRLGMSQPAAWRRVRRLEEAGVLNGLAVEVDREGLGFGVTVFLGVKLATKGRVSLEDFERAVTAIPEVQVVQHVLGLFDYRLRVVARDLSDFERVLRRRIMTLPGVGNVEANVLLTEERRPGPLGRRRRGPAPAPPGYLRTDEMRIVKLETFGTEFVCFVRVTTDSGETGWGQLSTYYADLTAEVFHRQVAPHAIGTRVEDLEDTLARIYEREHKYPGSYLRRAQAGLDTAVWDLRGKVAGKPVAELLGGTAGRVRAYASSMKRDISPEAEAARLCALRDAQGLYRLQVAGGRGMRARCG